MNTESIDYSFKREGRLWMYKGEPQKGLQQAIDYYFLKHGLEFEEVVVRPEVALELDGSLAIKIVADNTIPPSHALFCGERDASKDESEA